MSEVMMKNCQILIKTLVKLGHSDDCKIKIYEMTLMLFEGVENTLYLPFEASQNNWRRFFEFNRKELFIRNVLIKDFKFDQPIFASIFQIVTIVVNVKSKKNFIPDISRNKLDEGTNKVSNYII